MTADELNGTLASQDLIEFRNDVIFSWLRTKRCSDFREMSRTPEYQEASRKGMAAVLEVKWARLWHLCP